MSNPSQPSRDVAGFSKGEIRIDQPHGIIRAGVYRTPEIGAPQLVGQRSKCSGTKLAAAWTTRWSSSASTRPSLPIDCNQNKVNWIAAKMRSLHRKPTWKRSGKTRGNGWPSDNKNSKSGPRRLHCASKNCWNGKRLLKFAPVNSHKFARSRSPNANPGCKRRGRPGIAKPICKPGSRSLDDDRTAWDERNDRLQTREAAIEARHREIDGRQAQLYRDIEQFIADKARAEDRLAELERSEAKIADWESRLQSQSTELEKQTEALRQRAGELEIGRAELRRTLGELTQREAELDSAARQLGYRQQEIETALARYERLGVTEEKMQQLQEEVRKFSARRRYLDEAERS